ncbi:hypothetical protein MUO66_02520 [Candidatus Bathyarchaeota archaeon]|nr:hypothetical protein [Candidatus Bathyarchaeota archaeon]
MNKIVSVSLILLVCASMFCSVALNCVSADEYYEDHNEEYGDENNPWDIEEGIVPNDYYRDEDRTRNKDA